MVHDKNAAGPAHKTYFNSGNARKRKIRPIQNNLYDNLYVRGRKSENLAAELHHFDSYYNVWYRFYTLVVSVQEWKIYIKNFYNDFYDFVNANTGHNSLNNDFLAEMTRDNLLSYVIFAKPAEFVYSLKTRRFAQF